MFSGERGIQAKVVSTVQTSTADLQGVIIELIQLLDLNDPGDPEHNAADLLTFTSESRRTLFHLGAALGLQELLNELISQGADVNQRDIRGYTALHYAALYGHIVGANMLVECGADKGTMDQWDRSAQEVAQDSKHHDIKEMLKPSYLHQQKSQHTKNFPANPPFI